VKSEEQNITLKSSSCTHLDAVYFLNRTFHIFVRAATRALPHVGSRQKPRLRSPVTPLPNAVTGLAGRATSLQECTGLAVASEKSLWELCAI